MFIICFYIDVMLIVVYIAQLFSYHLTGELPVKRYYMLWLEMQSFATCVYSCRVAHVCHFECVFICNNVDNVS